MIRADGDPEALLAWLGERTGLAFPQARRPSALEAIERARARAGVAHLAALRGRLENDAGSFDALIGDLTIGETYFFREPAHFRLLRERILPDLARRRPAGHRLRAWSAGCASGEEAYSLAIVFEEALVGERVHLLATDLSPEALAQARVGRYRPWSFRGADAAAARRWTREENGSYRIDERIRRRVLFGQLNLAADAFPSLSSGVWGMDVVFCRNVLLYFLPSHAAAVGRRLLASLADEGWLVTSASDPLIDAPSPFEAVATDAGVVYRRAAGAPPADAARSRPAEPMAPLEPATVAAPLGMRPDDALGSARAAFARGDYGGALAFTRGAADPATLAVRIRALANVEPAAAAGAAAEAASLHPLSAELQYLHGVLELEQGALDEAERAMRRALYLEPGLALGHFALGSILQKAGDVPAARRSFRNVRDLCAARPALEPIRLGEGESAARLAAAAEAELVLLERPASRRGSTP